MFPFWLEIELTLPQMVMAMGGGVVVFTQLFLARR
jgi:hypothetical protein